MFLVNPNADFYMKWDKSQELTHTCVCHKICVVDAMDDTMSSNTRATLERHNDIECGAAAMRWRPSTKSSLPSSFRVLTGKECLAPNRLPLAPPPTTQGRPKESCRRQCCRHRNCLKWCGSGVRSDGKDWQVMMKPFARVTFSNFLFFECFCGTQRELHLFSK